MPQVQMQDGTVVEMPEQLSEKQAAGLKALRDRQKAPVEAPLAGGGVAPKHVDAPRESRVDKELKETWEGQGNLGFSPETIQRMNSDPLMGLTNRLTQPIWEPLAKGADLVRRVADVPFSAAVADLAENHGMDHTQAEKLYRDMRGLVEATGMELGRSPSIGAQVPKAGVGQKVAEAADSGIAYWFDRDPEAAAIARKLAEEGRPVAPGGYLGSAKRMQFGIELARKFGYDPTAKAEGKLAEDRVREMLGKVGLSGEEVDRVIGQMKSPSGNEFAGTADAVKSQLESERSATHAAVLNKSQEIRQEAQTAGQAQVDALAAEKATLEKGQQRNAAQAQKFIDAGWQKIDELRKRPGNVAGDMEKAVTGLKEETQKAASELYSWADDAAGNARVDTKKGIQAAKELLADFPKKVDDLGMAGAESSVPASLKRALNSMSEGSMTFGELHRLRSELRDLSSQHDLATSFKKGPIRYMASVVDGLLEENSPALRGDARLREAGKLLSQADEFYASNMQKFKDQGLRQVVDNLRTGIAPDPETVARQLAHSGNANLRQELLAIASRKPGLVERVRNADFQSMMKEARDTATGEIDTGKLASMVEDRAKSGVLKDFYGEEHAKTLQSLTRRLQQQAGKVSLEVGPQDNFVRALAAANEKADRLKVLAKQDPIKLMEQAVAEGEAKVKELMSKASASEKLDPLAPLRNSASDTAARELLNKPELLKQAVARWGGDHKAIQLLREEAARNILSPVLREEGAGSMLRGMAELPQETKAILFPEGLGKDLELLVKELKVMHGAPVQGMAGMSAGQAFGGGLKQYMVKAAAKVLLSQTVTNPRVVRILAGEVRANPKMGRMRLAQLAESIGAAHTNQHDLPPQETAQTEPPAKANWRAETRGRKASRWQSELRN